MTNKQYWRRRRALDRIGRSVSRADVGPLRFRVLEYEAGHLRARNGKVGRPSKALSRADMYA